MLKKGVLFDNSKIPKIIHPSKQIARPVGTNKYVSDVAVCKIFHQYVIDY